MDPDRAGLFPRRLDWDGLDIPSAQALIATPVAADDPAWLPELRALRRACRDLGADDPDPDLADLPFDRLLSPLVRDAWWRLCGTLPDAWTQGLTPRAAASLRHQLARRLTDVAALAWYEDFTDTRPVGATLTLALGGGATDHGTDQFVGWCRTRAADGMEHLLTRFPVSGRLLATASLQWQRATADLLEQIHRHRHDLEAAFGIAADSPIVDITPGLSDEHRGGRTVCFVDFDTPAGPRRVVHKPKDLRLEREFHDLVRTVNGWFDSGAIGSIDVVCGDGDYAFTSFAEPRVCPTGHLPDFYRAAGRLLGLLYVLGATDAHYENVVACGGQPILVDAETLFHPMVSPTAPEEIDSFAAETVLRTGMLPGWLVAGPGQAAYDPSALGVAPPPPDFTSTGWAHVNTDAMVRAPVPTTPDPPLSLPVAAGAPHPLPQHVDDLVAGFTQFHRACRQEPFRSQLLTRVAAFRGLPRRLVLRATRVYVVVQRQALSADSLTDTNRRAVRLEQLTRSSLVAGRKDPHWDVFHAELQDLENLDVPYFDYRLGSDEVRSALGPISGIVPEDGIDAALARIRRLDDDDLDRQVRLIRGSVHARFTMADRAGPPASPSPRSPAPVDREAWGSVGSQVMADLHAAALADPAGDGDTWLTLTVLPDGVHTALGPISGGYYDGRAGVAAAQRIGADLGFGSTLSDAAARTMRPVLQPLSADHDYRRFRHLRDLGLGFTGVGGLLRALTPTDGDAAGERRVRELLARFPDDLIARDRVLDLIGGVAGLIRPLADLTRGESDPRTAALLAAAAAHLDAGQGPDGGWPTVSADRPLTGLAHGAAGGGLALIEAGTALDRADWIDAGAAAFRYESACFDPDLGTWPDFRKSSGDGSPFMVAWCHGAPGIGLARLRALHLLPDHPDADRWSRDLEVAMAVTGSAADPGTDHLCCGMLGRAAVLRIAGRRNGRSDWVADADRLTAGVVSRYRDSGQFRLPFDIPDSPGLVSPGLMTGLSGVAAHLWATSRDGDLADLLL
ncbi:MAG: type 2 lanthipeptide synthetase LanM family protein [Candidatus Nanopelagicales bacterium]